MRDDFWNSWLHFAYLFCFKVWPMCIYNGYSIPLWRRLGNVKSWANWDVIKWLKAIRHFLKGTLALSSWKYYLLAWRCASHWEGSMSVHNTYAQIVLVTKKIISWFYFSFFLFPYLCINPDNSFKWGSWLHVGKRYWLQLYPIYLEQKIAKTFEP